MATQDSCSLTCPMRRKFLADCVRQATAISLAAGATSWVTGCGGESEANDPPTKGSVGGTGAPSAGDANASAAGNGAASGTASGQTTSGGADAASAASRFTFADYPQLQTVGGAIMTKVGATPIAVVRTGSATAVVLNATCPHQGCTVGAYNKSSQTFTCPCHGSVYGESGDLKQGPSTKPLGSYPATVSATDISAVIT